MIKNIGSVIWPPGYYIIRDRAPFYLTLLYMHRRLLGTKFMEAGLSALIITAISVGLSIGAYLRFDDMKQLWGISWSAPSPITWGIFILITTITLYHNGLDIFESYYLAFILAMGGGWLYEFFPTLFHGFNPFVFLKINAVKVFWIEFQILCLPIFYMITKSKHITLSPWITPTLTVFLFFYGYNELIIKWTQENLIYSYRWFVRLPAQTLLYTIAQGVKQSE